MFLTSSISFLTWPLLLGLTYHVSVTLGVPVNISIRGLLVSLLVTVGYVTVGAVMGLDSL